MVDRYKWSKQELYRERDYLLKNREYGFYTSEIYDEMIALIDNKKAATDVKDFTSLLKRELALFEKCRLDDMALATILVIANEIDKLPIFEAPYLAPFDFTARDIIDITHEFFESLDSEYYQNAMRIINRKHAIHYDNENITINARGSCYYNEFLKRCYIFVRRDNTLSDVFVTNHEVMHNNEYLSSKTGNTSPYAPLFEEIGSLYTHFATIDFLIKKGIKSEYVKAVAQEEYNLINSCCIQLLASYSTMEFIRQNKQDIDVITQRDINRNLVDLGLLVTDPRSCIDGNMTSAIRYAISYIAANTLYQNYDKQKQISILKEMNLAIINPGIILESHGISLEAEPNIKALKLHAKSIL